MSKPTHETFGAALAAAQAKMSNPVKNCVNPQYNSRYADLAAIRDAVVPALAAEGIGVAQEASTAVDGGAVIASIKTVFFWRGERHEVGCLSAPVVPVVSRRGKEQPLSHALGSLLTYLRRYSLAAACGVSADDDDDGNSIGIGSAPQRRNPPQRHNPPPAKRNQQIAARKEALGALLEAHGKVGDNSSKAEAEAMATALLQRSIDEVTKDPKAMRELAAAIANNPDRARSVIKESSK